MSLPIPSPSKKRKHGDDEKNKPEPSQKKLKKKSKEGKEKKDKKGKKSRGKSKDGQFQVVNASVLLSIPPKFFLNPLVGAIEMLDSLTMRYVPALKGVVLNHSNARFASQTAIIKNECPFSNCNVNFDATVWSPQIGMKLSGKINLCSPDHISLLVHQTFNVSISREHIPTDNWTFEYGPAENDPEFGPHTSGLEPQCQSTDDGDQNPPADAEDKSLEESLGVWVHKVTGDRIGGKEGKLDFTVIGLTVANQMLSLKGSLQTDPSSLEHAIEPAVPHEGALE